MLLRGQANYAPRLNIGIFDKSMSERITEEDKIQLSLNLGRNTLLSRQLSYDDFDFRIVGAMV